MELSSEFSAVVINDHLERRFPKPRICFSRNIFSMAGCIYSVNTRPASQASVSPASHTSIMLQYSQQVRLHLKAGNES